MDPIRRRLVRLAPRRAKDLKRIHGIPVVAHDDGPRDGFALGAVAGEGAWARLRELAREQGRRDGEDFVVVA
jgi:hypothetical protein